MTEVPHPLASRLADEGLSSSEWSNGPGYAYAAHRHSYDKLLVARSGSITFHLTELDLDIELLSGERLELPAETLHGATVGVQGVTCIEAHAPAGLLGPAPLHLKQGW